MKIEKGEVQMMPLDQCYICINKGGCMVLGAFRGLPTEYTIAIPFFTCNKYKRPKYERHHEIK